jgi:hypothetical protein
MNTKIPNIEVIRSLWRRVKKGVKVRDLKPVKDVKGAAVLRANPNPSQAALAPRTPQARGVMCPKNDQILSEAQRTSLFRVWD